MSDLIERLDNAGPNDDNLFDLCMESFGEIERLTAERDHYKGKAEVWEDAARSLCADGHDFRPFRGSAKCHDCGEMADCTETGAMKATEQEGET